MSWHSLSFLIFKGLASFGIGKSLLFAENKICFHLKRLYFCVTMQETYLTIIIIIAIGAIAGISSGIAGIGGGLIMVPAMIYFLGYSQKLAQGTSLGILLLPLGVLGVINYYQQGYVNIKTALIMGIGFIIGAYFGSKIGLSFDEKILKRVFAGFLILAAGKMLFDSFK